jgi:S-layer protein (TIGR01564 family)
MDVVSAADIAAKIGSLCYKEGTVEDGSADIKVHAYAESDDMQIYNGSAYVDKNNNNVFLNVTGGTAGNVGALFITAADSDYVDDFNVSYVERSGTGKFLGNIDLINDSNTYRLGDLSTLVKIMDINPNDWADNSSSVKNDDDASEMLLVLLKNESDGEVELNKKDALYMTLAYADGVYKLGLNNTPIYEGEFLPFLGQKLAILKIDSDDDYIALGEEKYSGILKEGDTYDLGNGYQVKINAVLQDIPQKQAKVDVQILKDGKVVKEKFDIAPFSLLYKDVGVYVHSAWQNVPQQIGYGEVLIADNVKYVNLGEEYIKDWKAYAVVKDTTNNKLSLKKDIKNTDKVVGIALRYEGDKLDGLSSGDEIDLANYATFKLDDEDKNDRLFVYFTMDETKEVTLDIGEKVSVLNSDITLKNIKANAVEALALTAPIAKLDTEVSLDSADKNLVLVGGPVANKLTKELVDKNKLSLDNNSQGKIVVLKGEANGHDVVVVAGGDRDKTREAALKLISML